MNSQILIKSIYVLVVAAFSIIVYQMIKIIPNVLTVKF